MVPNSKGYLNRFQLVNVPKVADLFSRLGRITPPIQGSETPIDVFGVDKNGAADAALRESLNEPPVNPDE